MDNAFVRPRPGDLLLCYDSTWYDKAIDAVEEIGLLRQGIKPPKGRPIYSHVAVFVGNGYIIEAYGMGTVWLRHRCTPTSAKRTYGRNQ